MIMGTAIAEIINVVVRPILSEIVPDIYVPIAPAVCNIAKAILPYHNDRYFNLS